MSQQHQSYGPEAYLSSEEETELGCTAQTTRSRVGRSQQVGRVPKPRHLPHSSDQSIPNGRRHPGPGFPGELRDGADALVPPSHQSRPSTRSVRAWRSPAGGEAAPWAGAAARPAAGPGDSADGGLAAVLRGRGAQRPLRRGGRKLPLRVGGLRGKGKRRDGADSRREPAWPLGPSGRRAPAHIRPRGGGRTAARARRARRPRRPPLRRRPLSQPRQGLTPPRRCFHFESLQTRVPGLFPLSAPPTPPHPCSRPVTPRLTDTKPPRLIIFKCLRRLKGTTWTPSCFVLYIAPYC